MRYDVITAEPDALNNELSCLHGSLFDLPRSSPHLDNIHTLEMTMEISRWRKRKLMAYADERQGEVHQRRPLRKRRKPCTKQWTHDPILLDWSGALIPMNQRHLSNRWLVMRPRAPVMLQLLLNLQLA
uniref:Uncharacterized protein n=1 Tax=Magallana gigas TaxID=29159 RepID=A0A8W8LXK2_MAGGI